MQTIGQSSCRSEKNFLVVEVAEKKRCCPLPFATEARHRRLPLTQLLIAARPTVNRSGLNRESRAPGPSFYGCAMTIISAGARFSTHFRERRKISSRMIREARCSKVGGCRDGCVLRAKAASRFRRPSAGAQRACDRASLPAQVPGGSLQHLPYRFGSEASRGP
jgi:hypothetical protein